MVSALSICNPVWLRSTYDNKELSVKVPLSPTLKISSVIKTCDNNSDEGKQFVHRFKNVIDFVPNIAIEKALHELERLALTQNKYSDSKIARSDSDEEVVRSKIKFSNPRKRTRKRK